MARAYTKVAIEKLGAAVTSPPAGTPLATSISAAQILLDRGWGKAIQPVSGEDGKAIEILVRTIVDGKG